jgi:glutamate-1-semialdehyde 2,1-aminomutase
MSESDVPGHGGRSRSTAVAISAGRVGSSHRGFDASRAALADAGRHLPGGVGSDFRLGPTALVIDRGQGPFVWDIDGNRYIDYLCGAGPIILGHDHPVVVEAAIAQVRRGVQTGGENRNEHEAASLAASIIPCAEQVRFTNTGSEAVGLALRLVRAATGRDVIVKFQGHYHGWYDPMFIAGPGRGLDEPGSAGLDPAVTASTRVVPNGDLEALAAALTPGDVAAVIVEPYWRGYRWHAESFLSGALSLAHAAGSLVIFDEVLSGFRVAPGGAQTVLGITPDLSTLAKAVANGFPVGGVAEPRSLMSLMGGGPVVHPGTYNGNPLSMAAAVATLRELRTGEPHARIEDQGRRLMAGLADVVRVRFPGARTEGVPASFRLFLGGPDTGMDDGRHASLLAELTLALLDHGVRTCPVACGTSPPP